LDDYSRLVDGRFYWKEQLPALQDSLMKWVIRFDVPESVYTDYTEKNTMPKNMLFLLEN
jgi:hypothetical protein